MKDRLVHLVSSQEGNVAVSSGHLDLSLRGLEAMQELFQQVLVINNPSPACVFVASEGCNSPEDADPELEVLFSLPIVCDSPLLLGLLDQLRPERLQQVAEFLKSLQLACLFLELLFAPAYALQEGASQVSVVIVRDSARERVVEQMAVRIGDFFGQLGVSAYLN